ncbi:immunoglobulin superfamily member 1-like [Carassius carassius]|uniref:immunoglobulin superfamily member 1-like n=1 Tax=Carassius carassius TaxID=217509 RepID=UPI0028693E97|nr:immunoglobulin superfamily member 1-like [Carassius carassius]
MNMRSLLILSVLLALIRGNKGQKPTVSLRPKFPKVYAGDDVTLICNREGGSKPTTWYFNRTSSQTHKDYLMLLTAVTPDNNNGVYECDQGGTKSDPFTITVLNLEPHAQLSPSVGGAVMTKGDGRNLVLQTDDDDLENWSCFVLRGVSTFAIGLEIQEKNRAVIFAELKEAERATFWCKKNKAVLRSNAVTLKKTEHMVMLVPPAVPVWQGEPVTLRCEVWGGPELKKAIFYKDKTQIKSSAEVTYTITSATQSDTGMYSCHATYRYSNIRAEATQKEGVSDAQELKVIGGPPAAVISASTNSLKCSCPLCPANCTSYHWFHTLFNDTYTHRKLSKNDQFITVEEAGLYRCRRDCGNGFSHFSNIYNYTEQPLEFGYMWHILVPALILFVIIIALIVVLKYRRLMCVHYVAYRRAKRKNEGSLKKKNHIYVN